MKKYIRSNSEVDSYRGFRIGQQDDAPNNYYVVISGEKLYHEDIEGLKSVIDSYAESPKSLDQLVQQFGHPF